MRRTCIRCLILLTIPVLSGCIAKTALDVATAPVRLASGAVDTATTSQSEADEKRGRAIRKREERLGQLQRRYAKEMDRCGEGDETACKAARATHAEMEVILPTIPVEPSGAQ